MATNDPIGGMQSSKITWAYIPSAIGIVLVPRLLCGVAWFLAHSAGKEGDARASAAKMFAIAALIIGIILGIVYFFATN